MFSFTRFYLRGLADLNEIVRRLKRNVILTIAITLKWKALYNDNLGTDLTYRKQNLPDAQRIGNAEQRPGGILRCRNQTIKTSG
jgi:hypothetical protein